MERNKVLRDVDALIEYFIKRFGNTREEAIKSLKEHGLIK